MKKFLSITLAAMMTLAIVPTAFAADKITVTVDGEKVVFDQEPINVNGRVMVPVRKVAEKMGWKVDFETFPGNTIVNGRFQDEDHVNFTKVAFTGEPSDYTYMTDINLDVKDIISGNDAYDDGEKPLKVEPIVTNGRTLLGIRDIAEGLYADIEWDGATKTVAITTKPVEEYPYYDKLVVYRDELEKLKSDGAKAEEEKKQQEEKEAEEKKETEELTESQYVDEVIRLVNEERKNAGLETLEVNSDLMEASAVRVKELLELFSHTRPDGTDYKTAAKEAGYSGGVGENCAGGQSTPEAAVISWMNSDGHRVAILNPKYKYIGAGYIYDSESTNFRCNWVLTFGY